MYRKLKMMQQKQKICSDRLPPLSPNYPWLVAHKDNSGDQIFYNIYDQLSCYRCRIPELAGKRIQARFHGWVILSNHQHTHWFLWNPIPAAAAAATSTLIRLPRLIMKDVGDLSVPLNCYLSSPPDVPGSILLLARNDKPNFVFCRLDRKRKRLRWIEMSYAKQLSSITGEHDEILGHFTYCNGKVYATDGDKCVINIHIVVKDKEVMITLLPFVNLPALPNPSSRAIHLCILLTGYSIQLFTVYVGIDAIVDLPENKPVDVYLYKLDMTSLVWEEMEDLKDNVFYVKMAGDFSSIVCCPAIVSELGGYVHILHERGKLVYSYNVKDKTISMSFMHCLDFTPSHIAVWAMPEPLPEFRLLQGVEIHGEAKCKAISKPDERKEGVRSAAAAAANEVQKIEANVLNLPFHVLEMILEFCVGIEYLNFRATCKRCHLAAPVINMKAQRRLQAYSLVSPWLMVFDIRGGIITLTDPMFGDKYFIKAPSSSPEIVSDSRIVCSRYGWLLLLIGDSRVAFFNPFTSEIHDLPERRSYYERFCFSAPPTSPDCMVVVFLGLHVFFHHFVAAAGEPRWHVLVLDFGFASSFFYAFPTFCGRDVYALIAGKVYVFREIGHHRDYVREVVVDRVPTTSCRRPEAKYFLATCNQHLLLVMVGESGETVEVFKLTKELEWDKMDSLGRHAIYICDAKSASTCLCMDAKTPEMENKIYFSRLHSDNGNMLFYSLETRRFHTFDGTRNIVQETSLKDFCGSKQHTYDQTWIEPTWCYS